jgi:MFS family permease
MLAIWTLFCLGNSSDVFLLLRAQELGLSATLVVLAYAAYNLVYASFSWPFGALSDRIPRPRVFGSGLAVFAVVYLGFAVAPAAWVIWPLFCLYGLYVAATEGVAKAWVADVTPGATAGTAFGLLAAATGGALLVSSILAGVLWTEVSPRAPFLMGACSAALALAALVLSRRWTQPSRPPAEILAP